MVSPMLIPIATNNNDRSAKDKFIENIPNFIVLFIVALVAADIMRHALPVITHNLPLLLVAIVIYVVGKFFINKK